MAADSLGSLSLRCRWCSVVGLDRGVKVELTTSRGMWADLGRSLREDITAPGRWNCRAIRGQVAMASSEAGSTARHNWPNLKLSPPLKPVQRTWSRRSAPPQGDCICWDLFMRRLTIKLAVSSVI